VPDAAPSPGPRNRKSDIHLQPLRKRVTMPQFPYRDLKPTPEAESKYKQWIAHLHEEFTKHTGYEQRSEIVRDALYQLYLGRPHGGRLSAPLTTELPIHVLAETFDPRNATLEPEYYGDIDEKLYYERKPLIWFWQMFDRSPVGLNHWLGFKFRCMLGHHIFKHIGKNVKIFQNVEFSFGYNLVIEDNCIIHKNVLLDDRGGLTLREGTSVSDYVNIFSHQHDIYVQADVTNIPTSIGPRARITYHSTVLAGSNVGENAMLGAMGLATHPIHDQMINVGVPAKPVRSKDGNWQKD
jgi:acetyltransferase-like isoleucine patch superfamily enzyme